MSGCERALLLDYGGVLTRPIGRSFASLERELGIEEGRSFELLVAASRTEDAGLIGALERGELSIEDFDARLRDLLAAAGYEVPDTGSLLERMLARVEPDSDMWAVAAQARRAGVTTALVSNSWGTRMYPWERFAAHFDVTVISGEVGLRKPDPAIFRLAAERVGVAPSACAFVDDLARNVAVARELGMFGVVHDGDSAATAVELSGFLEVELEVG